MLKSIKFLSEKSRGRVGGGTKLTLLAPVILGLVPRILFQQGTNLVNKLALLLNKCWGRRFSLVASKQRSVAFSNKVMDTRLPQPAGCGDKYDVLGFGYRLLRCARNDGASNGEGLHRPWCHKILGTGPSMTGVRGAGFVRLLRRYTPRNDGASNGEGLHRTWCHKILGTGPSMTGARGANSYGRSMIEMLGVLAIIGVLSVGGIAGYSKAMEKYKINKVTEQYSYLFQGLIEHGDSLRLSGPEDKFLTNIVTALNLIPTSWTLNTNNLSFIDDYGNNVDIITRNKEFIFNLFFRNAELNTKTCEAFFQNVFQPLHTYMNRIHFYDMKSVNQQYMYYGDTMCSNGRLCLRDMTVSDIHKACGYCSIKEGSGCFLVMYF